MQKNFIISDNKSNILFSLNSINLAFNIVKELLNSQYELLLNLDTLIYQIAYNPKDIVQNSVIYIPEYFISYDKDDYINKYHFKLENKNIYIYHNDIIATDNNTILFVEYFNKKYNFNLNNEIEIQNELNEELKKYDIIKNKFNEDKKIFYKLYNDINNNIITFNDINLIFIKKYNFFIDNINIINDPILINKYEILLSN